VGRERICFDKRRGVAAITLARPPVNVIDRAMIQELRDALREAETDRGVRAVVFEGEGRCFSGGVEIREHLPDQIGETLRAFHELVLAVYHCPVPTLARVNGPAMGGGFELVLACDTAVASERATFGTPEITLGCFAPVAVVLLRRTIGEKLANEILLSGRTLTAVDALTLGLVNEVESEKRSGELARAIVDRIRAMSRDAVEISKRAIREADGLAFAQGLHRTESLYLREIANHPDAIEGIKAYLGKRKPTWAR
jgi:cyclohexa-1,5-dienecarbonyl-CoA hydratase